jgi:hypothetical protein
VRVKVLGVALLANLCALLAGGPAANAAILTTAPETESFALTAPQVSYTVTNDDEFPSEPATVTTNSPQSISQPLTFNQFDGGLGTLIGVTITFSSVYGATAVVAVPVNGDDVSISFFSDASVNHSLTNAALIVPASSLQQFSATCTAPSGEPCPGTPVSTSDNGVVFNSLPTGLSLAAALGSFVGAGTYDLTATLNSALAPRISPDNGTGFADNTTFSGTLDATWNGNVSVVYTYQTAETSVPVPLSLYLLAAGLGGIALLRRYRR